MYGHVFVVLGLLASHPSWGIVALPLLARLYVRKKDLPGIDPKHRPTFRTKLESAVELLRWAKTWPGLLGKPIWVVADGAYAKANVLKPAKSPRRTVVSRLREDAALWTVPGPKPRGRRGPAPTYGDRRIGLAKRAGPRRGWDIGVFDLYGKPTEKRSKTFVATGRRGDPGGAGGRAGRVGGLLLYRRVGLGRGHPGDDGRPLPHWRSRSGTTRREHVPVASRTARE